MREGRCPAGPVQFVASLPNYPHGAHVPYPPLVEYDVGENALQNEIFVEPLRYADGHLETDPGYRLSRTDAAGAYNQQNSFRAANPLAAVSSATGCNVA